MSKENAENEMSLSKQRKMARKKEIADKKRNAVITKIVAAVAGVLVVALVTWGIVSVITKKAKSVAINTDYSAQINDNGMIKGVKAADYITAPDYSNISVSLSDVEYTDEKVDSDILSVQKNNMNLNKEEGTTAADGDKVNIDYVGTVDGVEFDGGSATGYDLELGSGSFIDDFEDQIVGHVVGDVFNVEVTFPDDYSNNTSLAGHDAVFSVTLNGVYELPEFNDEFVQEHLSDKASTVEEYRQYLKDTNYEKNLKSYIEKYIIDNTSITEYPSAYLKQLKGNYKASEYSYYEYMNSMYTTYYGSAGYSSFEDYISKSYSITEEEYDATLTDKVVDNLKYVLFCQYVAEKEGINATLDDARAYYIAEGGTDEDFDSQVENYGKGYPVQQYICEKVVELLSERATVQ